jgi:hypothetical protein
MGFQKRHPLNLCSPKRSSLANFSTMSLHHEIRSEQHPLFLSEERSFLEAAIPIMNQ